MLQPPLRQPTQSHVRTAASRIDRWHRRLSRARPSSKQSFRCSASPTGICGARHADGQRWRWRARSPCTSRTSAAGCRSPRRDGSSSAIARRSRMPAASSRTAATIPFSIARSISSSGPCQRSRRRPFPPLHPASRGSMSAGTQSRGGVRPCAKISFNADESPIAWLRRRKDRSGEAMISQSQFDAGRTAARRFLVRADDAAHDDQLVFLVAHATRAPPRRGSRFGGRHAATTRQPLPSGVRRALAAVGPELCGVLIDVCCHLKGLGGGGARWPAGRSGRPRSCCSSR